MDVEQAETFVLNMVFFEVAKRDETRIVGQRIQMIGCSAHPTFPLENLYSIYTVVRSRAGFWLMK